MKYITVILLILSYGCSNSIDTPNGNSLSVSEKIVKNTAKPTIDSLINPRTPDSVNYIDPNGLKQGKWITRGYKNKIVKIETFENDTLNGYWFNWNGMQEVGSYKSGKKNGFFRVHYENRFSKDILQLKLYNDDSLLWSACPAADSRSAIPVKGFKTNVDSIFIKAPHYNNTIWYEGFFYFNKPQGIHKSYDTNGRLLSEVNYSDSAIVFTKFASEQFISSTEMLSLGFSINHK